MIKSTERRKGYKESGEAVNSRRKSREKEEKYH